MTRNRAKCKLCGETIESFHATDYIMCKCGEISVADGQGMRCGARDYKNFIRIDDEGNEITVVVKDQAIDNVMPQDAPKPTRSELMEILSDMIKTYEELPQYAMVQPTTHYDLLSVLLLVRSLFNVSVPHDDDWAPGDDD